MLKYLKFIAPLTFLLSLFLICSFKTIPNGKLWNNYSVLYVPVDTDDREVISTFKDCSISDYVSLSEQYLPINISQNSIEITMFKLNIVNDENEYHVKRNNYFFDKSNQYRLYYIPARYKNRISDVVSILNNKKISCGVDSSGAYPWIIPLLGLVVAIVLSLFAMKKYVFISGAAIPLIFLYNNPFYPVALSFSLLLLVIFFISNTWRRNGFVSRLINTYSVPAMLFISALCAFSSNIKTGLLFFAELTAIISLLTTCYYVDEAIRQKKSFVPVLIKPAHMINVFAKKTNTIMTIIIVTSFLFIGIFFLTSSESVNSHFSKILLPSNSEFQDANLVQLEDYYKWAWDIKTAPYKSLNKNEKDTLIEYPKYFEDTNGLIKETKVVMAYNQNFKENIYNDIEKLPFNSIEEVIKSEGIRFNGGYKATGNYHNSLFGIIMMFICLFVLLFLYISIIIRRGNKK